MRIEWRVESRLIAEDEVAAMEEGGVVRNMEERAIIGGRKSGVWLGGWGNVDGGLGPGGGVRSGCGTEA